MSFKDLKKSRSKRSLSDMAAAAEQATGGKKSYGDDRYWNVTRDKEGNGRAVIRFLPACNPDNLPWIQYFDHGFQGPTGMWYIENSRTTIGEDDPVGELNSKLWNSGDEGKEQARAQKRRLHYVANVLVLEDPANPANEGKVFLYKFGKKIFEKIKSAMQPEFDDEDPMDPFDFWEGADFKLRVRKVDGWVNYDRSEFGDQGELYDGDEARLEQVYESMHDLEDLIAPDKFKSYDELKRKLNKVLCIEEDAGPAAAPRQEREAPAPRQTDEVYDSSDDSTPESSDDDDDGGSALDYFKKLADDD